MKRILAKEMWMDGQMDRYLKTKKILAKERCGWTDGQTFENEENPSLREMRTDGWILNF